jgi:hypothetical protein
MKGIETLAQAVAKRCEPIHRSLAKAALNEVKETVGESIILVIVRPRQGIGDNVLVGRDVLRKEHDSACLQLVEKQPDLLHNLQRMAAHGPDGVHCHLTIHLQADS